MTDNVTPTSNDWNAANRIYQATDMDSRYDDVVALECARHRLDAIATQAAEIARLRRLLDHEGNAAHQCGMEDGLSDAMQSLDRLTGGDGEYFASTSPGEGCPGPVEMQQRIVDRFTAKDAEIARLREAIPTTCDGIEQDAFETFAAKERFDMQTHPLHWLFLDARTSAARQGWKAGLEHAASRMSAALSAQPDDQGVGE